MAAFSVEIAEREPIPVIVEGSIPERVAQVIATEVVGSLVRTVAAPAQALISSVIVQAGRLGSGLVVEIRTAAQSARVSSRIQMREVTADQLSSAMMRADSRGHHDDVRERLLASLRHMMDVEFQRLDDWV